MKNRRIIAGLTIIAALGAIGLWQMSASAQCCGKAAPTAAPTAAVAGPDEPVMGCDAPVPAATEQSSETPSATATTQPASKECPMMKAHMEKLAAAIASVDAATAALNGGDTKAALAELTKAKEALQAMKTGCEKCMKAMADGKGCPMMAGGACPMAGAKAPAADAGVVNVKCPIMGGAINPAKVPDNLTRTYKGQKVGFCCAGCPDAWDKLTDEQKDAKLAKSLPEKK